MEENDNNTFPIFKTNHLTMLGNSFPYTFLDVLEYEKKTNPDQYNRRQELVARALYPTSEVVRYVDNNGKMKDLYNKYLDLTLSAKSFEDKRKAEEFRMDNNLPLIYIEPVYINNITKQDYLKAYEDIYERLPKFEVDLIC